MFVAKLAHIFVKIYHYDKIFLLEIFVIIHFLIVVARVAHYYKKKITNKVIKRKIEQVISMKKNITEDFLMVVARVASYSKKKKQSRLML